MQNEEKISLHITTNLNLIRAVNQITSFLNIITKYACLGILLPNGPFLTVNQSTTVCLQKFK